MAFAIVVPADSDAAKILDMLQPPLRAAFFRKMRTLHPLLDSTPSDLYDSGARGQEFKFKVEMGTLRAYFTVAFLFADSGDENTLIVTTIGMTLV